MSDRALGCGDTARCSRGVGKVAQSRGGLGAEGGVGVRQAGTARTQRGRPGKVATSTSCVSFCPKSYSARGIRGSAQAPTSLSASLHGYAQTVPHTHRVTHGLSRRVKNRLPGATTTPPQELRAPLTAALLGRRGNETFSERRETQTEQRLGNHSAALPRALLNLQLQGRPKAPGSPTPWGCWRIGGISRVAEGSSGSRSCPPEPVLGPWCTGLV